MKKFIKILIFSFIFINIFSIKAHASDYTINNLLFEVVLTEEGHAEITENWNITYHEKLNNSFSGYLPYKLQKEEKYSLVSDFSAYIDGKECDYTHTKNEDQNLKYNFEQTNKGFSYSVFFPSQNQTRDITIKYTLEDVIKHVNNDYYIFAYRFLPKGFNDTVNNLIINIKTENPQLKEIKTAFSQTNNITRNNNSITITDSNINDIYKIKIKMTGNIFQGLKNSCKIRMIDFPGLDFVKNMPLTKAIILIYLWLLSILLCAICVSYLFWLSNKHLTINERIVSPKLYLYILIPIYNIFICINNYKETQKEIQIKQTITINPEIINSMAKKWQIQNFSLIEIMSRFSDNMYLVFLLKLLPLLENKTIGFSKGYKHIFYPSKLSPQTDKYTKTIIDILDRTRIYAESKLETTTEQQNTFWVMPVKYLDVYFELFNSFQHIRNQLKKMPTTIDPRDMQDLDNDLKLIKRMLKYVPYKEVTFEDIMLHYHHDTNSPNIFNILFFLMQTPETLQSDKLMLKNSYELSRIAVMHYYEYYNYCIENNIDPKTSQEIIKEDEKNNQH